MNDRLARAVLAARIYTGSSLRDIGLPYYSPNRAERYRLFEETPGEVDLQPFGWGLVAGSMPRAFEAWAGQIYVDHDANGDGASPYALDGADLGSRFGRIAGTAGSCGGDGTEWSACPHDDPGCLYFDDEPDCDDDDSSSRGGERDMFFIVRSADDGLDLPGAPTYAAGHWDDELRISLLRFAELSRAAHLRPPADTELARLTRYYSTWAEDGRSSCNLQEYEDCIGDRGARRLMQEGNLAFIGQRGLTLNDLMNGAELACWAGRQTLPVEDTSCTAPTTIATLTDAHRFRGYLECRANEISANGAGSLLQNIPQRLVEALRSDGLGVYGSGSGEIDAQVSELRAALIELSNLRFDIARDLRAYSATIRALDSVISQAERSSEIEELSFASRTLDRVAGCVAGVGNAVTTDAFGAAAGARAAAAAATCLLSVAASALELRIRDLALANIDESIIAELARFDASTAQFSSDMSQRANAVRSSLERIDAALSRLRATQTQARRALSRALLLDDDGMGEHFEVNRVYRARYNTTLRRYLRSHQRAIRSAFIARIALEQRLGMPLSAIEDDLFSDEPPSAWVDELCTLPSIDYDRLRMAIPVGTGERDEDGVDFAPPDDYSGAYVGDYVRRLEDVFESYSFVHPFREGTDTAVISLRDDVFRTRAPCPVISPNLLFNGGRLDVFASRARPGWSIRGCNTAAAADQEERSCVAPERVVSPEPPGTVADARFGGRALVYRVAFGGEPVTSADTRLEQVVPLEAGRYRLSWYQHLAASTDPRVDLHATGAEGDLALSDAFAANAGGGWERRWIFFDVFEPEEVAIALRLAPLASVTLAGVMLERANSVRGDVTMPAAAPLGATQAPAPFYESADDGTPLVSACIDHTGYHFQREAWEDGCVRVCRDGYDGNCPDEGAETRCYWQTSFGISSDALETALLAGDAGFAAGNYNYRIDSVAVNLVGTGLRDCSGRATAGCYASGSTSFTILHQGPYLVRNALGSLYDAPLFPGRLEAARALAAERYVTNPLSSADRALIEPFTRYELQGRPLGGSLILRIWEDPSFQFRRLEDVQIVLSYRYWQHQR